VLLRGANDFPEFMESPLPKSAQGADHRHSAADIKKNFSEKSLQVQLPSPVEIS
jgi:hypothetical protein